MFTRSSSAEPRRLEPRTTSMNGVASRPQERTSSPEGGALSVIGNDLKIIGQGLKIISKGILQVDGEIEGDVQDAEVIIGERGQVTGMVAAQQVVIRGKVSGLICGKTVVLQSSSRVDGDIHHMSLSIEQAAMFEGRSRRAANEAELNSVFESKAGRQQ
jgi:cytoskeletal protein CcmA (bactofilin family)